MNKKNIFILVGIILGVFVLGLVISNFANVSVSFGPAQQKVFVGTEEATFCDEGFTGNRRCNGDDVEEEYQKYLCYAATPDGKEYCECRIDWRIVEECEFGCSDGECVPDLPEFIEVCTSEDLDNVRNNLFADYKQVCDIDLQGFDFEPIGAANLMFKGTYDGNGYRILNFQFLDPKKNGVGIFGYAAAPANLNNIRLENVDIIANSYVGALLGSGVEVVIQNSQVTGTIDGTYGQVGCLSGRIDKSTVFNSSSNCTISGGIFYIGGLIGQVTGNSLISHSYSIGNANGDSQVGGLVGILDNSIIDTSYSLVDVTTLIDIYAGGLVGHHHIGSEIHDSYAGGSVTGPNIVGGLVGFQHGSLIENSYAIGAVRGEGLVGGLSGDSSGTTIYSYWDTETSGQDFSASGEGRTTEEMTSVPRPEDTYVDWNFETIWDQINGEYPWFRWQN